VVGGCTSGLYVYFCSHALIERNLIYGNKSTGGAGVAVIDGSNPLIRNNIVVCNNGSGVRTETDSLPQIVNNTIVANSDSGIQCWYKGSALIKNNIISNNSMWGVYVYPNNQEPTLLYNDVWSNKFGNYYGLSYRPTGSNGNISVCPKFVEDNTYSLNYDSPCINAGEPDYVPTPNEVDFDGNNRLMGGNVDIGAKETLPFWNLTSGDKYTAIQDAIDDAIDGQIIIVLPGRYCGEGNRDINFRGKKITLRSIDPNKLSIVTNTVIDCGGTKNDPHRGFNFHNQESISTVLSGLTIINGGGVYDGGAIRCFNFSSPTIKNCVITNNSANGRGGAIYCDHSSPRVIDCIITGNTATTGYGGAIACFYDSCPLVLNCIFADNHAQGSGHHGGGVCCWEGSDATLLGCIVAGNSAEHRGGGLYAYWSSPTFINCTVVGNRALEGGGVASFSRDYIPETVANPTLINCVIRNNRAELGPQAALINTIRVWPWAEHTEMTFAHCNLEGGQGAIFVDTDCIVHWQQGNIDADANFLDPGFWNDANTPTDPNDDFFVVGNYHLTPGSACIDAGDNNSVPEFLLTDIDGEERVFGGTVDMGADEFVTNPYDLNSDGIVDYRELETITGDWLRGSSGLEGDFYDDGFIDFLDIAVLAEHWLWKAGWYE